MPSRAESDPGYDRESSSTSTIFQIMAFIFIGGAVIFVILLAFYLPSFQSFSQSLGSGLGSTGTWFVDFVIIGGPVIVLVVATYVLLRASSRSGAEALSDLPEADYFEDEKGP